MSELRGLPADIYRWAGPNCSNDGLSSRVDRVTVIGTVDLSARPGTAQSGIKPLEKDSLVFAVTEDRPAVLVAYRHMGQKRLVHVVPTNEHPIGSYMAGGAFVYTSDSRWSRLIGFYGAVALHDRYEGGRT